MGEVIALWERQHAAFVDRVLEILGQVESDRIHRFRAYRTDERSGFVIDAERWRAEGDRSHPPGTYILQVYLREEPTIPIFLASLATYDALRGLVAAVQSKYDVGYHDGTGEPWAVAPFEYPRS